MRCVVGVNFSSSCKQYHYFYDLNAKVEKGDELQVDSPYSGITTVRVVEILYRPEKELELSSTRLKHILKNLTRGEDFETNNFSFKVKPFKIKRTNHMHADWQSLPITGKENTMRDLSTLKTGADIQQAIQDDQNEMSKKVVYNLLVKALSNVKALTKTVADYQKILDDLKQFQVDLVKDFDAGTLDQEACNKYAKRLDELLD